MEKHSLVFTLILYCEVISDWVELPKVTPSKKIVDHNYSTLDMSMLRSSTPILAVFTEIDETVTSISPSTEMSTNETLQLENQLLERGSLANISEDLLDNILLLPDITNNRSYPQNGSVLKDIEFVNDNEDASDVIEETLKGAKNDLFYQQDLSTMGKLEYLQKLQDKLYVQIRRFSQGIWTQRQARGKKLMKFVSLEGALMTIAFLTFAVFLIKVVYQFIRGLQNTDVTMLLNMSSTASPLRLPRTKREESKIAAAHLLRYMDEFSCIVVVIICFGNISSLAQKVMFIQNRMNDQVQVTL